ncbi:aminomethyltransferase family protein [Chachezhania sediminis]|uniref:hypothetical protein n=1 Tax=Chachezhania sediminis TaxID=2599291 RepID=UPI00131D95DC|nr:hypothetical protein [Chachezhania sediminis]
MRDDADRWPAPSPADAMVLNGKAVSLRRVVPARQVLVSGERTAALTLVDLPRAAGWPEEAGDPPHALSLRRDRILVIDGPAMTAGWCADLGLAVSDVTCGLAVFEVTGPAAMTLLATGTEIALSEPSASVLRLWHGFEVMICRLAGDRFRIHTGAGRAEALWQTACAQARLLETPAP